MLPFTLFAPAKINLALHVLARRADGYHELDSIVAFADIGDRLTFTAAPAFSITSEGPFAAALPDQSGNIITRTHEAVAALAARRNRRLPPVKVHLLKNLPVASGIGGGSSNAAAAMKGFLRLAGIAETDEEVQALSLKLGADVPVCMARKPCRMQGIGERITPLPRFAPRHALRVNPLVEVSTPAVFARLGIGKGQGFGTPIADVEDASGWRNDLTSPAIALAPVIGEVLHALAAIPGVTRTFMSGSGATCVALHDGEPRDLDLDRRWWTATTILS